MRENLALGDLDPLKLSSSNNMINRQRCYYKSYLPVVTDSICYNNIIAYVI